MLAKVKQKKIREIQNMEFTLMKHLRLSRGIAALADASIEELEAYAKYMRGIQNYLTQMKGKLIKRTLRKLEKSL